MSKFDDLMRLYREGLETAARIIEEGGDAKAIRDHARNLTTQAGAKGSAGE